MPESKIKDALVINNPGTMCDENYFARSVSDVTCIFAGFEGLDQLKPPLSLRQYSPSRFAALAYQIPDAKAMRQAIKDAIIKRIGYLYISNSPKGDNPWAELPSLLGRGGRGHQSNRLNRLYALSQSFLVYPIQADPSKDAMLLACNRR